jgi:deoxyribose-phosphate aldolase
MGWTAEAMAGFIDHTLLKAYATTTDIENLCREARNHGFYAVCVNSMYVPLCTKLLENTPVKICSVVGFPLGAGHTAAKVAETRWAVGAGADEIDMVIPIGAAREGNWDLVAGDISAVVEAAMGKPVKAIIETCYLDDTQKMLACKAAEKAGAAFVKTSTGFAGAGATIPDIVLMRNTCSPKVKIKASGGIRDLKTANAMIEAGADRIGASSGLAILAEITAES